MPGAQRAAAFRRNRREQAGQAHEILESASPAVLMTALGRQLKRIQTDLDHAPTARDVATRIIKRIVFASRNHINVTVTKQRGPQRWGVVDNCREWNPCVETRLGEHLGVNLLTLNPKTQ
jgi:hypothetical protein